MVGTRNRPLQEAPDVLDGVGVNVATDPFLDVVVDCFMGGVFVGNAKICGPGVGYDPFGLRVSVFANEGMEGLSSHVAHNHHTRIASPLDGASDDGLTSTHPLPAMFPASNPGFVHLNGAREGCGIRLTHGGPNPMAQVPRRLVRNVKGSLHLVGRDTLLGLDHQVRGYEPLLEGQVGVVENGSSRYGKVVVA